MNFASFFKGVARVGKTFQIDIGPIHARGAPAILVGVTGIVIASGIAGALINAAASLPETFREANGLARTLRGEPHRLNP